MQQLKQYKKLILSCVLYTLFWLGAMLLIRHYNYFDIDAKDNLWTLFFSIVGVIYAITIAFLLVMVLEKYNKFNGIIDKEINSIQDIRDFLILFKAKTNVQKNIYQSLIQYVKSVYEKEWVQLKKCRENNEYYDSDTSKELYQLIDNIGKLEPKSEVEKITLQEIIVKMGEITTLRSTRVNLSFESLSPVLYFYLKMMSSILTIPFVLYNGNDLFIQGIMISAVVIAMKILYAIIKDFDNPLVGVWSARTTELELFVKKEEDKYLNKLLFS
jgi:hypothetical protein